MPYMGSVWGGCFYSLLPLPSPECKPQKCWFFTKITVKSVDMVPLYKVGHSF